MAFILLAEDSLMQGRLTRRLLEDAGHKVEVVLNGQLALDAVNSAESRTPDLVVTDLEMPEMTGLELVHALREDHPTLPIILLTAHGSEEVAVQALKEGASSYVAKRNQARDLVEVVEDLISLAQADREHQQLLSCITRFQMRFVLPNDQSLVSPLVSHVEGNLTRMGFLPEGEIRRVGVALREALINALYHGNLEVSSDLREGEQPSFLEVGQQRTQQSPYRERRITFDVDVDQKATFVVTDEGPGFDVDALPDPYDPANIEKASGRGILLIRTFMDEVIFNPVGNQITMIKNGSQIPDEGTNNGEASQ